MERLAGGATVEEIAVAWGRSSRSVYRALSDVRQRLGARTDMHAIVLWLNSNGRRNGTRPSIASVTAVKATAP
jgi:DNA-binding CsgD family transcriptional regulator